MTMSPHKYARLRLVAAVPLVVLLAAFLLKGRFWASDPGPLASAIQTPASTADSPAGASQNAVAATSPSGLDALGAPDDPLPASLPLPAIADPAQSGAAADALAQQVLAGGPDSLSALVTALQASGIGIIGPGNEVVAKPAEPWQGMVMQRWEVRLAAAMVLPERTVTFTLGDLAGVLVAAEPALKGVPLEQLLVTDLRALADSPAPTKRFLGRFIAALGRNATNHPPYDLLGTVDPQTIQLDGLQASLIFRRLATDVLMLAGTNEKGEKPGNKAAKKAASFGDQFREWLMPTAYAQGQLPCTISERAQNIEDWAAFGTAIAWGGFQVGEMGLPGLIEQFGSPLGNAAAFAATLLAYSQFIATYAALDADVTLDAPPLVRTKKQSPQTGERKQLTAIVKMNIGNAQMLNCLRAMLIAVGQDFSLPNDGPVKGAHVLLYGVEGFDQAAAALHGGGEAIVQFAAPEESRIQGSGSASASPVTNAVTGDDGKVQIGVEGRGQKDNVSDDATAVNKSATVRLQVALKGADLFGDVREAAVTAAGGLVGLATLPLSVLQRAQWASTGHYTFPVRDWRDGPAQWKGTIKYTKTTEWNESQRGEATHREQEVREVLTLAVNVDETLEGASAFGNAGGAMQGTANAQYERRNVRSSGRLNQCSGVITDMKSTQTESAEGNGAGKARASLGISADGQYSISLYPDVSLKTSTSYFTQSMSYGKLCAIESTTIPTPGNSGTMGVSVDIQGNGRIDPSKPDHLSGSTEEKEGKTTQTISWDLERR